MSKHFHVAVYTSVMAHNIEPVLNSIFGGFFRPPISTIFDRTYNKPDPNAREKWDTIRDVDAIWGNRLRWNEKNTILLDNEARKFQDVPENGQCDWSCSEEPRGFRFRWFILSFVFALLMKEL